MNPTGAVYASAVVVVILGGVAGYVGGSLSPKPAPIIIRPTTTVVSPAVKDGASPQPKSVQRLIDASWGEMDQKEVNALSKALEVMGKDTPVTIFCESDQKCGDLQMDFENAFETAHWQTKLERPLIDDTIGIATSSVEIQKAINEATADRFEVKLIPKNPNVPYYAVAIGKKPK
jgi:hypothetical protein